nr:sensor histidine kinase [uncultured Arsenicibacter sp.]
MPIYTLTGILMGPAAVRKLVDRRSDARRFSGYSFAAKAAGLFNSLLVTGVLLSVQLLAGPSPVDSLKALLKAHPQTDTGRVNRLNALSHAVRNSDPDLQVQYAREALALAGKLRFTAGQAQAYLHLSLHAMTKNQYRQAADYARQALYHYRRSGEQTGQINCLNRLAFIATEQGNYPQSIAYIQQALVLTEAISDKSLKAYINFLMAQNYTMLNDYEKARTYVLAGLPMAKEAKDLNEQCRGLTILGIISTKQHQFAAARRYYEQVLPLFDLLDRPLDRASVQGDIAEVCIRTGQYADAFRYGREVLEYVRRIDASSYLPWIEEILAEAHLLTGQLDSALVYANRSLRAADEGGMRDISMNAAEILAEAYAGKKNYAAAFRYQRRFMNLKDSLRGEETIRQTAALQYKFDLDKKQSRIALLTKNHEIDQQRSLYQRRLLYASGIGVLLLAALAVVLFRNVRVKQRVNQLLSQQKELMENQLTGEILIQRQQLLESQLKARQEELRSAQASLRLQQEKERIARDLHDHVGAQLSIIASSLDHVRHDSNRGDSSAHMAAIGSHARLAIGSLRETIWAINREHILLGEFRVQLHQYINRQQAMLPDKQLQLVTDLTDQSLPLTSEQALNLFRICQEGVSNAVRHAQASLIGVQLQTNDKKLLQLRIEDNGTGFDPQTENPGHYGLLNMQLRAEGLGGQWQLDTAPGQGCRIFLEIPLENTQVYVDVTGSES